MAFINLEREYRCRTKFKLSSNVGNHKHFVKEYNDAECVGLVVGFAMPFYDYKSNILYLGTTGAPATVYCPIAELDKFKKLIERVNQEENNNK